MDRVGPRLTFADSLDCLATDRAGAEEWHIFVVTHLGDAAPEEVPIPPSGWTDVPIRPAARWDSGGIPRSHLASPEAAVSDTVGSSCGRRIQKGKEADMIQSTLLSMVVLGQAVLTGSTISVREAQEQARLVVVAKPIGPYDILGGGVARLAVLSLRHPIVLKGELKEDVLKRVWVAGPGNLPEPDEDYIFFINGPSGNLNTVKIIPVSRENMEAVRKEIEARKKR